MIDNKMLYANYAATTPSLSAEVVKELSAYLRETHLNAGRNFEGLEAGAITLRARRAIAKLFGIADPLRVIFTSGATASLNMAIAGLSRAGTHVITTTMEHNATARPLELLKKNGIIELDYLQCNTDGTLDSVLLRRAIKKNTRLLVMTHASNVLGTILPIEECFRIAHENNIFTILDTAQTAGVLPFTADAAAAASAADIIAFAGHKGLCGLEGTGGFIVSERAAREMNVLISGGTGSASDSLFMPEFLPDKFEAGTQNIIGILSLAASVEEILKISVEQIRKHEMELTKYFIQGLEVLRTRKNKFIICGTDVLEKRVAVVSLFFPNDDAGEISRLLFEKHGIITRSGLHCAPLAHKTCKTFPSGTVRFSFGRGTSKAELDTILESICCEI